MKLLLSAIFLLLPFFATGQTAARIDGLAAGTYPIAGSGVISGTITTGKVDSVFYNWLTNAGSGDVTQAGLAAGSVAVSEQALTGFLRFSSTNTAFLDGASVATNAITVTSNATSYASFVIPSKVNLGVNIGGTYYRKSYGVYTNGSIGAVFFESGATVIGETLGNINFTNATHAVPEVDVLAFVVGGGSLLWFSTSSEILDEAAASFSPSVFPTSVTQLSTPSYASFNGKHVGDGSGLVNVPLPSGVITNNWQSGAGAIFLTNTISAKSFNYRGDDYSINLNYFPGSTNYVWITNGWIYLYPSVWSGQDRGLSWGNSYMRLGGGDGAARDYGFLMRAVNGIGLEVPSDNGVIRLTDDHRIDGLVKLAGQSISGLVFPSNNFSGMLAFQSPVTNGSGTYIPAYAGIRAKNATGVTVYTVDGEPTSSAELWFYNLIPPQLPNASGGFRSVGDTNWFAIGKTNALYVKGLTVVSNYINQWPTAPHTAGDVQFVNSNGFPYILLSTNGGGGGATTWTATNKLGW